MQCISRNNHNSSTQIVIPDQEKSIPENQPITPSYEGLQESGSTQSIQPRTSGFVDTVNCDPANPVCVSNLSTITASVPVNQGRADRLNRFAKAAAVIGIQSVVNMIPVWLGLNKAAGVKTPWNDPAAVITALTIVSLTDWLRNLSHVTYFQMARSALPEHTENRREFIAAMATCALDLILAVPLINIRQKIATDPAKGFGQLAKNHLKDYYQGLVGVAANNLVYTNTLFPSIEITSRLLNVSDSPRIQSLLGSICCIISGAAAWPIEVGRVLMTQEDSPYHSISDLLNSSDFNFQLIAKSFAPMIMVYASAGLFMGLANMYLRQSFQSANNPIEYQQLENNPDNLNANT